MKHSWEPAKPCFGLLETWRNQKRRLKKERLKSVRQKEDQVRSAMLPGPPEGKKDRPRVNAAAVRKGWDTKFVFCQCDFRALHWWSGGPGG